jgi:predicted site-specific integrase-resolvase
MRTAPPDPPRVAWRPNHAAKPVGISRAALYNALKSGELRALKAGCATLILHDDLVSRVRSLPLRKARAGTT